MFREPPFEHLFVRLVSKCLEHYRKQQNQSSIEAKKGTFFANDILYVKSQFSPHGRI